MTSPTPDAAALDAKPAPAKEQKEEATNGLTSNEPTVEAESKSKSESLKVESKSESNPESKLVSETKQPSQKSEELVINGKSSSSSSSSSDEAATNGDGAKKESPKIDDVALRKMEEKSTEEVQPQKPTEDVEQKNAEKSTEEGDKLGKTEEVEKVEKVEKIKDTKETEQPETSQTEDVQMTDATIENEASEPPRDDKASKSSPKPQSPAAGPGDDKVMTDSVMAEKPAEKDATKETKDAKDTQETKDTSAPDATPPSEAKQGVSSVETSVEVSMGDAPSSKVSRERDDETGDEPAAKRAKTEPKEEEPTASTAGTPAPAADTANRLSSLSKWEDEEFDKKPITVHQRREIRKIIARVKKTKHGGHFRDAVAKLWPQLGESYLARIDKPMDLSEIDRNIRDPIGVYATFGDMRKDLSLIYENTMTFNGVSHEVTASAFYAIRSVWQEAILIPEEEPTRPKRQSSGPVSSPPREVAEPKPRPPPAVSQEPSSVADRRGSTATEADRPKRTVRAPKPKDIDYTKPSRKKLKPELQFCCEVLAELMHPKNQMLNTWFMEPVDAEGLNIPTYYSVIKKPMDLGKVSRLLSSGEISNLKEFDRNVRLIFTNCYQFNGPAEQGNPVSLTAKQLEDLYSQQMKGKDAWLSRYAKANAPAASHGSDEDEEEDSDDGGNEAPVPSVDYAKEVQEYSAKLEEESKKLNSLFASGADSSSVDCQRVIVDALQKALYNAAQAVKETKPSKQDKASKKSSSKPSKSKSSASSNPPHRKSLSGPPSAKKPSVTKKPAPKKNLSAADKDAIASAINDLEAQDLDRAIDIIKRDTGQNENNEGELELDIDQLSNEALLKLWDLLRKVLPGFGKSSAPAKSETVKATPSKATPKSATKPKKNKPMSAKEQESRIDQLKAIRELYKSGQEPSDNAANEESPNAEESSDDSDSEEE